MINSKVHYVRIRDVKNPKKAYNGDAGTDFFVPEYAQDLATKIEENSVDTVCYSDHILIGPHGRVKIPSGIRFNIKDNRTYLDVANKSGIATKKGLVYTCHVVDSNFHGEFEIGLANLSDKSVVINYGQKIVQLIQKEYIDTDWEEQTLEDYEINLPQSERGAGSFGSSGV